MKVKVITHFSEDDPEMIYDYTSVTVEVDDRVVQKYGDSYHDKGRHKAQGYVDALKRFFPNVSLEEEERNDDPMVGWEM